MWILFEDANAPWGRPVQQTILFLIGISTVLLMLDSYHTCWYDKSEPLPRGGTWPRRCKPQSATNTALFATESLCVIVFTFEYVLRLLTSPAAVGLRSFVLSVRNGIDLLSIIPYYWTLAHCGGPCDGSTLPMLRQVSHSHCSHMSHPIFPH